MNIQYVTHYNTLLTNSILHIITHRKHTVYNTFKHIMSILIMHYRWLWLWVWQGSATFYHQKSPHEAQEPLGADP